MTENKENTQNQEQEVELDQELDLDNVVNKDDKSSDKEEPELSESDRLKKRVIDLELIVADQSDKMLRSLAEVENLRKRSQDALEKASKYAVSKFAEDLVLEVENLYLSIDNMPNEEIEKSEKLKNFVTGVTMTQKGLVKIFEKNGIKRVNPINEKFDHNYHEAIAHSEGGGESGVVKKVIQAGYSIHDRLIRPALVEVCK
jgi:molecular chaperone GrpE